jgi:hypothetical protein
LLRVPEPGAGLAGAGFGVRQCFLVALLNQFDAVQQRSVHCMGMFVREISEVVKTAHPVAFPSQATVVAAIAGRIKKTFVWAVFVINAVQYKQSRIRQRFK